MNSHLGQSWIEAGEDLGLRVVAPFVLTTNAGESHTYDAVVCDFGSRQGMLLMEKWDESKARVATAGGYGYTCMDASQYKRCSSAGVGLVRRGVGTSMAMTSNPSFQRTACGGR